MLQSMTGFGKSESVVNNKKVSVELRSLNSKFIDLFFQYLHALDHTTKQHLNLPF